MAHFPKSGRIWYNGQTSGVSSALDDFDAKALKTINGVTGDAGIAGPISTPTSTIQLFGANALVLQTWPAWNAAQVIIRTFSPLRYFYANAGVANTWQATTGGSLASFAYHSKLWIPVTPDLIDAARIVSVTAYFVVSGGHGFASITEFPRLYIERRHVVTGVSESLAITGSHEFPTPANAGAYINGGVPNALTITLTNAANSAIVDLSTYVYAVGFIDDNGSTGTVKGSVVTGFRITHADVNDQRQA